MGHAGAIISGGKGTAAEKFEAFRQAGIHVVESPALIGETLEKVLKRPKTKKAAPRKARSAAKLRKRRAKPQPKKKKQPIAQVNLFTPIAEEPAPHGGVPYFETRLFQCKYILNTSKDPHNIRCCGGVVYRTTSWCRKHYNEVFIGRISPETQVGHLSSGKTQVASKFQFRRM